MDDEPHAPPPPPPVRTKKPSGASVPTKRPAPDPASSSSHTRAPAPPSDAEPSRLDVPRPSKSTSKRSASQMSRSRSSSESQTFHSLGDDIQDDMDIDHAPRPVEPQTKKRASAAPQQQVPQNPASSSRIVETPVEDVERPPKVKSKKSGKSKAKPESSARPPASVDHRALSKDEDMDVDEAPPRSKPRQDRDESSKKSKTSRQPNGHSADTPRTTQSHRTLPVSPPPEEPNATATKPHSVPVPPSTPPRLVPSSSRDHPSSPTVANGNSDPFDVDMAIASREKELTEEERAMTVEQWLRHEIETQYEELKREGERRIREFREQAEEKRKRIEAL